MGPALIGSFLLGHYNGYVRRKILQSDVSDTNVWLRIPKPEVEYAVPDWPEANGPNWYPRRTGILGDWGYGMDCSDGMSRQRDNSCFITVSILRINCVLAAQIQQGTFPFQAVQIMAWDAELLWAGEFTGHSVMHDLEVFVWFMWVFCINMDGPFNKRRFTCAFDKTSRVNSTSKRIKLGVSSASKSRKSKASSASSSSNIQQNAQQQPPYWSRPGLYQRSTNAVAWQKCSIMVQKLEFTAHLSPYFAKHHSVVRGFRDLHKLFAWEDVENAHGNVVRQPPAPTTYKAVIDILKNIRDGIDATMDGPPSKEEFERARTEFAALLMKGQLETPLLGNRAGPSGSQSQTKKRSLDND